MTQWKKKSLWALAGMWFWTMEKCWHAVGSSGCLRGRCHKPMSHILFEALKRVCCEQFPVSFGSWWLGNAESGSACRAAGTIIRNHCSKLAWKKRTAKYFFFLFWQTERRTSKAIHAQPWETLSCHGVHQTVLQTSAELFLCSEEWQQK